MKIRNTEINLSDGSPAADMTTSLRSGWVWRHIGVDGVVWRYHTVGGQQQEVISERVPQPRIQT